MSGDLEQRVNAESAWPIFKSVATWGRAIAGALAMYAGLPYHLPEAVKVGAAAVGAGVAGLAAKLGGDGLHYVAEKLQSTPTSIAGGLTVATGVALATLATFPLAYGLAAITIIPSYMLGSNADRIFDYTGNLIQSTKKNVKSLFYDEQGKARFSFYSKSGSAEQGFKYGGLFGSVGAITDRIGNLFGYLGNYAKALVGAKQTPTPAPARG